MKAYAITVIGDKRSGDGFNRLDRSHKETRCDFSLKPWAATVPEEVDELMVYEGLDWTYPWERMQVNTKTGLELHPYTTKNRKARMACFLSHYRLWLEASQNNEWLIIFEDDAEIVERIPLESLPYQAWGAVGLCDPRGATRRAQVFHERVQSRSQNPIVTAPWVDDNEKVPQGLAGNSAYMISPQLAAQLINKAHELGCWPNDALMCQQLFPFLGVTTTYYTRVQGRPSNLA
jgi:hypothetical protein